MSQQHIYKTKVTWTGNKGDGTKDYLTYSRDHTLSIDNKPELLCSSDTVFRGDGTKFNPEDMLVYSLSSCHMLWYFHLCADNGITVVDYIDNATGTLTMNTDSNSKFTEVTLNPIVTILELDKKQKAIDLHHEANKKCFIANSCNFNVSHNVEIRIK